MSDTLLATCWTSAGDTWPGKPDERSPVDIRRRVEAVAATGWDGFGIRWVDLATVRETIGLTGLARLLDDHGLAHREVELAGAWWPEGPSASRIRDEVFDAAAVLGSPVVKVDPVIRGEVEAGRFVEEFGRLADAAAIAGVRLALEPMPFSNLRTPQEGVDVITAVGNASAGLSIDVWHTVRSGVAHDELARIVPPELVFQVELGDGAEAPQGTLLEDTVNARLLPGDGAFDVAGFVRTMRGLGWSGPWGVELISAHYRALPIEDTLAEARQKAAAVLAAGR